MGTYRNTSHDSWSQLSRGQPGLFGQVECLTSNPGVCLLPSFHLWLLLFEAFLVFAFAQRALRLLLDRPTQQHTSHFSRSTLCCIFVALQRLGCPSLSSAAGRSACKKPSRRWSGLNWMPVAIPTLRQIHAMSGTWLRLVRCVSTSTLDRHGAQVSLRWSVGNLDVQLVVQVDGRCTWQRILKLELQS
ncbi:hypothetical protein BKA81DRAFT_227071 [Phyllosticta paracitricarpa]|uniref:Uncharacterized protein n=1 Tax=Phyllosticta paracitricarpa TaxID=2016321 RepID=A0ABR1NFZ1_9PEZI